MPLEISSSLLEQTPQLQLLWCRSCSAAYGIASIIAAGACGLDAGAAPLLSQRVTGTEGAAHKVDSCVRHFGRVFTLPVHKRAVATASTRWSVCSTRLTGSICSQSRRSEKHVTAAILKENARFGSSLKIFIACGALEPNFLNVG